MVSYYDKFVGVGLFDSIGQGVVSKETEIFKRSWFENGQPKISFELYSDTLYRITFDSLNHVLKKQSFIALNDLNSFSVNWELIE